MNLTSKQARLAFDLLAVLIAFLAGLVTYFQPTDFKPPIYSVISADVIGPLDHILMIGGSLLLFLRHRYTLAVFIFASLALIPSTGSFAIGLIALYTVSYYRSLKFSLVCALITVLSYVVHSSIYGMVPSSPIGGLILGSFGAATALAWGQYRRSHAIALASLAESVRQIEVEKQLLLSKAQQDERSKIAREMHDVLGHRLSLLALHAGALEYRQKALPDDVAETAAVIGTAARGALEDLRTVIGVLRTDDLPSVENETHSRPFLQRLEALFQQSIAAGIKLRYSIDIDSPERIPQNIEMAAFRIVQEALTNTHKHAADTAVTAKISGTFGTQIKIEIVNPLPLTPIKNGKGVGLIGLSERVSLIGGLISYGPTNADEFKLEAVLPWPSKEQR